MDTVQEIERAIKGLTLLQLAELYTWLDRNRWPAYSDDGQSNSATVFEQGLGLFGNPEDSALLDEVVRMAYEERHRPGRRSSAI